MINDIYTGLILEAAAALPETRRLDKPDASATKVSRICGSELTLDLNFKDGVVSDFGLDVQACALGQAAASIIAKNLIGAKPGELFLLRNEFKAMLKDPNSPITPSGERWSELAGLQAIRDYPQRHTSTLLMVEAIAECLGQAGFEESPPK